MTNNVNVWQVKYDTSYWSSSGMQKYTIDNPTRNGLVVTSGDSLADVEDVIRKSLSLGCHLVAIHRAEWLGAAIAIEAAALPSPAHESLSAPTSQS